MIVDVLKGNTPTHVGKTGLSLSTDTLYAKHPHARGEDTEFDCRLCTGRETPPRTWGRRLCIFHAISAMGNTPTHVGKTRRLI